jgi:integrase
MSLFQRGDIWWYEFLFGHRRVRESAKTTSKTVAKQAEQNRRRELERGFNGLEDKREDRIRSIKEMATEYRDEYCLRHKSSVFVRYAVRHVVRLLGTMMAVDVTEKAVCEYQNNRIRESASPKTINEEVGVLLRLLGESGDVIRMRLRRQKSLKLAIRNDVGKAFSPEEKEKLKAAAKQARSPAIYPALMLALNAGMRDSEIRGLQWGRVDLRDAILTVGASKTEAGEGRTIPLNSDLLSALAEYSAWYEERFGPIRPDWYVFPFGKPRPHDPTRSMVTLKTSWDNVRKRANVSGRWHDNRHTMITDLCESGAGEQTIRDIAGHVSPRMMKHYSHIRMEAKRKALESIIANPARHGARKSAPNTRSELPQAVSSRRGTNRASAA